MTRRNRPSLPRLSRVLTHETGVAFAALAIWLLSLLVPMHLASRMATELRLTGYDLASDWSLCLPSGQTDENDRPIMLCPATTACSGGLLPAGTGFAGPIAAPTAAALTVPASQRHAHRVLKGSVQPRAPPMTQDG